MTLEGNWFVGVFQKEFRIKRIDSYVRTWDEKVTS